MPGQRGIEGSFALAYPLSPQRSDGRKSGGNTAENRNSVLDMSLDSACVNLTLSCSPDWLMNPRLNSGQGRDALTGGECQKKYKNKKGQQPLRLVPAPAALYYGQLGVPNFAVSPERLGIFGWAVRTTFFRCPESETGAIERLVAGPKKGNLPTTFPTTRPLTLMALRWQVGTHALCPPASRKHARLRRPEDDSSAALS